MLPLRRHDPPETILAQNQIRVPELVPIRHQRMAASLGTGIGSHHGADPLLAG
jgi:hypothetical protein